MGNRSTEWALCAGLGCRARAPGTGPSGRGAEQAAANVQQAPWPQRAPRQTRDSFPRILLCVPSPDDTAGHPVRPALWHLSSVAPLSPTFSPLGGPCTPPPPPPPFVPRAPSRLGLPSCLPSVYTLVSWVASLCPPCPTPLCRSPCSFQVSVHVTSSEFPGVSQCPSDQLQVWETDVWARGDRAHPSPPPAPSPLAPAAHFSASPPASSPVLGAPSRPVCVRVPGRRARPPRRSSPPRLARREPPASRPSQPPAALPLHVLRPPALSNTFVVNVCLLHGKAGALATAPSPKPCTVPGAVRRADGLGFAGSMGLETEPRSWPGLRLGSKPWSHSLSYHGWFHTIGG